MQQLQSSNFGEVCADIAPCTLHIFYIIFIFAKALVRIVSKFKISKSVGYFKKK